MTDPALCVNRAHTIYAVPGYPLPPSTCGPQAQQEPCVLACPMSPVIRRLHFHVHLPPPASSARPGARTVRTDRDHPTCMAASGIAAMQSRVLAVASCHSRYRLHGRVIPLVDLAIYGSRSIYDASVLIEKEDRAGVSGKYGSKVQGSYSQKKAPHRRRCLAKPRARPSN